MQAVVERGCGLDVHQATVVACLLVLRKNGTVHKQLRFFGTTTRELVSLRDWLFAEGCTHVGMESTGVYGKPVYAVLEGAFQIVVANAQHGKKVPGRKTDVKDAEWLADLLCHGLLKPSFVPPKPIRELRDLTRYRRKLVEAQATERNRLRKVLEGANIKLSSVATDVFGVSGRLMLRALIEGKTSQLLNAGRIIAIDTIPSRLDMARAQGAEVLNFNAEDPIETIKELTNGIGMDRVIDAVGVDANRPHSGPAARPAGTKYAKEKGEVAPQAKPHDGNWEPGDAPSIALSWSVEAVAKAGTVSIIGVYGEKNNFPIGEAMNKNLTVTMGNCNHRRYIPQLVGLVRMGDLVPSEILTQVEPMTSAIEAYKAFDKREPGWIKVKLEPKTEVSRVA
jgi:hypothetical protein